MAHPKASPSDFDEFASVGKVLLIFETDRHGFIKLSEKQHDIINATQERQDSPTFMVSHVLANAASVTLEEMAAVDEVAGWEGIIGLIERKLNNPEPHPNEHLRGPAPRTSGADEKMLGARSALEAW